MTFTVLDNMLSMEHLPFSLSIRKDVKRYRFFSLIETGDNWERAQQGGRSGRDGGRGLWSLGRATQHRGAAQESISEQGRCLPLGIHPTQLPSPRGPTQWITGNDLFMPLSSPHWSINSWRTGTIFVHLCVPCMAHGRGSVSVHGIQTCGVLGGLKIAP